MQVRSIKQSTATLEITAMLCKTITGTNERRGKAKQSTGGGGKIVFVYPNSLIDGEKEETHPTSLIIFKFGRKCNKYFTRMYSTMTIVKGFYVHNP